LSPKVYVEESPTAFFNLSVLDHKPNPLTVHARLCTPGRCSSGRDWLTRQLRLEQTQWINPGTNSIDGDSSIAVYIDARKGRIGPCRRKLDDWRKLKPVSKIKHSARYYAVTFIDSCWSKLFRLELILERDRNPVPTVRSSWLSSPSL
jgi:hypothetical protein